MASFPYVLISCERLRVILTFLLNTYIWVFLVSKPPVQACQKRMLPQLQVSLSFFLAEYHRYDDELVVPIIENTPEERDLQVSILGRNRESYKSVHVLLNLSNAWLAKILSFYRNEFNKFNKTRAQMLDSIYHMMIKIILTSHFWCQKVIMYATLLWSSFHTCNVTQKSVNH